MVIDMGGTTTDIALLGAGVPALSQEGVTVGGWQTMVEAVQVHTSGLGGDSGVRLDGEAGLAVGPRRIVPLSLLVEQISPVLVTLRSQWEQSTPPIPWTLTLPSASARSIPSAGDWMPTKWSSGKRCGMGSSRSTCSLCSGAGY